MYSVGMTYIPGYRLGLPRLDPAVARRPYGDAISVRTAAEIRRTDAHEHRIRLAIWLGALVPVAVYLAAAYGVAALDALGLLP